jgi:hypothetical protein
MNENFKFLCSNIAGKRNNVFLSFMSNSLKNLQMNVVHIYISYLFSPLAHILCWKCVSCPLGLGPEQQTVPLAAAEQFLAQTQGTCTNKCFTVTIWKSFIFVQFAWQKLSFLKISENFKGLESQVSCEDSKREDPFKISQFCHRYSRGVCTINVHCSMLGCVSF